MPILIKCDTPVSYDFSCVEENQIILTEPAWQIAWYNIIELAWDFARNPYGHIFYFAAVWPFCLGF